MAHTQSVDSRVTRAEVKIKHTEKQFDSVSKRLDDHMTEDKNLFKEIKKEITQLKIFQAQLIGGCAVLILLGQYAFKVMGIS